MFQSFRIGRLFGSDIRIHGTFLLLLAFIGIGTWAQAGTVAALASLTVVLALFACVLAHEFGHALMARAYGIRTPDITLLPIGGLARLERMPRAPAAEIAVALAGPAVNLVIWTLLVPVLGVETDPYALADPSGAFLAQLAAINLALLLFNLLPAFPMDGGRVLRALLSLRMERVKATRIAAVLGQVMAAGFVVWALVTGQLMLILIAAFIVMAARAETRAVAAEARPRGPWFRLRR
ncbi:site-2 protease family protein [Oceaniglobus roseus]|uniref:site-2 protease family protein n=1 Tax=Oceaniglobus roseus TaxID=1737570 RepID=UPI000C7F25C0|nr:site-2 protease family protein [Kandeliimicrobium roseum]